MLHEIKSWFEDDYIYMKNGKIKPFSLAWWLIRFGQTAAAGLLIWGFYILMWLVFA